MMDAISSYDRATVLGWTGPVATPVRDRWEPAFVAPEDKADYIVGPAGSGARFQTIQAAVDQAIRDAARSPSDRRHHIQILPGWFAGPVYIPKAAPPLTLQGSGAEQTILAARIDAQMPGRDYHSRFSQGVLGSPPAVKEIFARIAAREVIGTGSAAVLRVERDDTIISDLRVENLYTCDRPAAAPKGASVDVQGRFAEGQHQAVALHVVGADRVVLRNLRLTSYQDTLYLQAPSAFQMSRVYVFGCLIEGDLDFIFGGATAFFEGCEIRARLGRVAKGWSLAPSTNLRARFGFVFDGCAFTNDAPAGSAAAQMYLGRQWFEGVRATPYGTPPNAGFNCSYGAISGLQGDQGTISQTTLESVGKCAILGSRFGAHLNTDQLWDGWSTPGWNPRYRPAQHSVAQFHDLLGAWIRRNGLSYDDLPPQERWLVAS